MPCPEQLYGERPAGWLEGIEINRHLPVMQLVFLLQVRDPLECNSTLCRGINRNLIIILGPVNPAEWCPAVQNSSSDQ